MPTTAATMVALIRSDLATSIHTADARITAWRRDAAEGRLDKGALADAALLFLETLREEDAWLDMSAAGILTELGEPRHLARLRAARPGLRPRVAIRDWRFEVDRTIAVIAARASGCDCAAEAAHGAVPNDERWQTEERIADKEPYQSTSIVRCRRCGKRWRVIEDDSYHYPTFRWTPMR
jgi:hypothetical protein